MTNVEVNELIDRIGHMSDRELIKALATLDDYTIEARVIYESDPFRLPLCTSPPGAHHRRSGE